MKHRRRFKQIETLDVRLTQMAQQMRDEARTLPPGRRREILMRKVRQSEMAAELTRWLCPAQVRAPG
jgi:hypothetical protein